MNCERYRQQLMDMSYGEGEMDQELRAHLEVCEECREFRANQEQLQDLLGELTPPEESGFREVKGVLLEVYQMQERRRLIYDLVKFGGLIALVFSLYYLLYQWQGGKGLLISYVVMYLLFPLVLIPAYRYRARREEETRW